MGALILFWIAQFNFKILQFTFLESIIFTALMLSSGLGLDVDSSSSKPRRVVVYSLVLAGLIGFFGLIVYKNSSISWPVMLVLLAIIGIIIIVNSRHRGVFHSWAFILSVGVALFFGITYINSLKSLPELSPFIVSGWIFGGALHLMMDKISTKIW